MNSETALMIACETRNEDAIHPLLSAGAEPNINGGKSAACIHHAVDKGCSKNVLETIVSSVADVNVTSQNNQTPLMIACENGNTSAINVLLNAEADPNITDADGNAFTMLQNVSVAQKPFRQ